MGRAKLIRLGQIVAGAVAAALAVALIWNISAYQAQSTLEARYRAQEHAAGAEGRIARSCVNLQATALVECVAEQVEATREEQRAEYDLSAQNRMAEWAFWVMVMGALTTGLTAIALYFVSETLTATRAAVEDTGEATEAMKAANEIAQGAIVAAQAANEIAREADRAWVQIGFQGGGDLLPESETKLLWLTKVQLQNVGRAPAFSVYVSKMIFVGPASMAAATQAAKDAIRDGPGETWSDGVTLFPNTAPMQHTVMIEVPVDDAGPGGNILAGHVLYRTIDSTIWRCTPFAFQLNVSSRRDRDGPTHYDFSPTGEMWGAQPPQ